jgi:hypothetical protein
VDINLNTLKRDILDYLKAAGLSVFRSVPGSLDGLPMVLWDVQQFPDYQAFLETAQKAGAEMVLFATREFTAEDVDEALEQLQECEMERDEQRDLESRLREMRSYEGMTCSLELAFDHRSRLYVYEVQPDWYEEFLGIEDDIVSHQEDGEELDDSLGGYFSRN